MPFIRIGAALLAAASLGTQAHAQSPAEAIDLVLVRMELELAEIDVSLARTESLLDQLRAAIDGGRGSEAAGGGAKVPSLQPGNRRPPDANFGAIFP